jgi:rare lipoprotein A
MNKIIGFLNCKRILWGVFILVIHYQGFSQTSETGMASFYNDKFEGRSTASGAPYKQKKMTAAHRTLPFNTRIKVTNLSNKKTVVVTNNDRGPFVKDRVLDLSKAAAIKLDFIDKGVTKVKWQVVSDK